MTDTKNTAPQTHAVSDAMVERAWTAITYRSKQEISKDIVAAALEAALVATPETPVRYADDRARLHAVSRDLSDTAFSAFIAMDENGQREFAKRLNSFHEELGHSMSVRWTLQATTEKRPPGTRLTVLETVIAKVNDIRNSIIGCQTVNWSEHIYPLVAALEEAGVEGAGYPSSRANVGTMLERTLAAESEADRLRAITLDLQKHYTMATEALKPFAEAAGRFDGIPVDAALPQQCWFTPNSLRATRSNPTIRRSTMASTELFPCPFCGGEPKLKSYRIAEDAMGCVISCTSCLVQTTEYEDAYTPVEDATDAWNRRVSPAPKTPLQGEPAGYLVKRYDLDGVLLDTELSFTKPVIRSTSKTEFVPLFALATEGQP